MKLYFKQTKGSDNTIKKYAIRNLTYPHMIIIKMLSQ